jgi:hypothetical protein
MKEDNEEFHYLSFDDLYQITSISNQKSIEESNEDDVGRTYAYSSMIKEFFFRSFVLPYYTMHDMELYIIHQNTNHKHKYHPEKKDLI